MMPIDEAIQKTQKLISTASSDAEIKLVKISDQGARMSVYAPADEVGAIKDAAFQPVLDLLTEGLDVQVFVYDRDNPTPRA